jgi:hypothetical protein
MPRKAKLKEPPLWWPMFASPNVHTTFPIEADGFGLVPPDDFRIQAIAREQRRFGSFMNKFKTEFGDPVQPSAGTSRAPTGPSAPSPASATSSPCR